MSCCKRNQFNRLSGRKCQLNRQNILLLLLVLAMFVGIGLGVILRVYCPQMAENERHLMYLEFPGTLLMRMLRLVSLPLIVSSLIGGMSSLPSKSAGKLGTRALVFYLSTTFLAAVLGIVLVASIRPGRLGRHEETASDTDLPAKLVNPVDAMLDLIRNILPTNIVGACIKQTKTLYETEKVHFNISINDSLATGNNYTMYTETGLRMVTKDVIRGFRVAEVDGSNMLGLVFFAILFGIVIGRMNSEAGRMVALFFNGVQDAMIRIVWMMVWYFPVGIVFLLAARILDTKDPLLAMKQLSFYILTVMLGLLIHTVVTLPLIYTVVLRKNPLHLLRRASPALFTVFGIGSSSATLPVTLQCLKDFGVDERVTKFMAPVGAVINMDGTAIYEAVAAIFIAQYSGVSLTVGQIITVSVTATAAAIGAASIPQAGLVTLVIVLTTLGLPPDAIAIIFPIDWLVDRCRGVVNIWGDCIGASVVAGLSRKQLEEEDDPNENYGDGACLADDKLALRVMDC